MKHLFFYSLLAVLLASCARPPVAALAQVEQLQTRDSVLDVWFEQTPGSAAIYPITQPYLGGQPLAAGPEMAPTPRKRRFLGIFRRGEPAETVQNGPYPLPKKVKGNLTINHNYVQGNQTNQTQQLEKNAQLLGEGATSIDKAKGPTATAGATATDQANAGIASTIDGDNNTPQFTNTATPKPTAWEEFVRNLTSPLGKGICVVVVVLILAKATPWLITQGGRSVDAWKRMKSTNNQA